MADLEDVTLDGRPLQSLRVADLKAALEERGLSKSGQKNALVKRLKGALMLENLQKTSTPHVGLQPNSQIGEEMSQNSFIKQYLAKQQELLRQRLEREAREAYETNDQEDHTTVNNNTSHSTQPEDVPQAVSSQHKPPGPSGEHQGETNSNQEPDVPGPPASAKLMKRSQEKPAAAASNFAVDSDDDSEDGEEDGDDEDWDRNMRRRNIREPPRRPATRERSGASCQPQQQHIPPPLLSPQLRQPTPPPSPPPELSFPLPDTPKQSPPSPEVAPARSSPSTSSSGSSSSGSRSSSPEPQRGGKAERKPGPLTLLARKMASEGAFSGAGWHGRDGECNNSSAAAMNTAHDPSQDMINAGTRAAMSGSHPTAITPNKSVLKTTTTEARRKDADGEREKTLELERQERQRNLEQQQALEEERDRALAAQREEQMKALQKEKELAFERERQEREQALAKEREEQEERRKELDRQRALDEELQRQKEMREREAKERALEQERREREMALEKERVERERQEAERKEQERIRREQEERLEQERIQKEKLLEQQRLELERERIERERIKKEEQERIERERALEQERKAKERLQKEKEEMLRLEAERLEMERLEKERLEKERRDKERAEMERLEKERAEKERMEKERAEKERMEKERLEKERAEKEKIENERLEKERAEKERIERERLEKERAEKERLEKERMERERVETERQERERAALERERLDRKPKRDSSPQHSKTSTQGGSVKKASKEAEQKNPSSVPTYNETENERRLSEGEQDLSGHVTDSTMAEPKTTLESPEETPKAFSARKISLSSSKSPGAGSTEGEHDSATTTGRKRRWGSSTAVTAKKPSISITTDSLKSLIPDIRPCMGQEAVVDLYPEEAVLSGAEDEDRESPDQDLQIRRTVTQVVLPESQENGQKEAKMSISEETEENDIQLSTEKDHEEKMDISLPEAMEAQSTSDTSHIVETTTVTPSDTLVRRSISQQKMGVSITIDDPVRTARQPSPPRGKVSNIVHVRNLVRPFTLGQLKELLGRTGSLIDDGFWIDKIKSHCFVTYSNPEEAVATRAALHGVKWPQSNPKFLSVDFCQQDELDFHKNPQKPATDPEAQSRGRVPGLMPLMPERDQWAEREREMERRERARAEREWDRDKVKEFGAEEREGESRRSRSKERRRKERGKSKEKTEKKEKPEEPPAKLLDDLFQKTKAAPCIYWLPLTEEQYVQREAAREERRKEREKLREEEDKKREEERKEKTKDGGSATGERNESERDRERDRARERDRQRDDDKRRDGYRRPGASGASGSRRSRSRSDPRERRH
ncbi:uncharacterized protein acin1a [Neosynchiropus ocellatus]